MDIYDKTIELYGVEAQKHKLVEELGELKDAMELLMKSPDNEGYRHEVMSEMADVLNMLTSVGRILGITERDLEREMEYKMNRAVRRYHELRTVRNT